MVVEVEVEVVASVEASVEAEVEAEVASVEAEVVVTEVAEVEEEVQEVDLVSQQLHSDKVKDKCSERNNGEYYNIINPYKFFWWHYFIIVPVGRE